MIRLQGRAALLLLTPTLGLAFAMTAAPALASGTRSGTATASGPATSTTTSMYLACSQLSPTAGQYAVQHGFCTEAQIDGQVGPDNTVGGNCGTSTLTFYNQKNGGWMTIYEAATSTEGPIVYAAWAVYWSNLNTGGYGSKGGTMVTLGSSWWHWDSAWTRNGLIEGSMQGYVRLIWGGVCYFNVPSASAFIT